jgi:TP901 family phage tail tape measure protein
MAAEFIIETLLQVGLDLKGDDLAALKKKLSAIEVTVDVDMKKVKAQTDELTKTFKKLQGDRSLLERAATKGPLTKADKENLPAAFNNLKAFQGQLNKVVNTLKNLGDSEGKPVSTDLASLHRVITELGATSRNIAPLIDNVSQAFKENSKAISKAQADTAKYQRTVLSQQRTAEILERARRTRATQTPEGRKVFLSAARGNAEAISTADKAKQGRSFAASAVTASERALQLERDRPVPNPLAIQRAERKLNLAARTFNDLNVRANDLAASEAETKRIDREQKQAADKAARRAQTREAKQQTLERNVRAEVAKSPEGQKAYFAAERGKTSSVLTAKDASAGVAFANKELVARKEVHRLTQEIFDKDSEEVRRALRDVEAAGTAYHRLTQRVQELAEVENLRKTNKRKADKLERDEASIALDRTNRGRQQRVGRSALERAGGVDADASAFGDVEAAKKAQTFVKGELGDLVKLQKAYGNTFGFTSDQAKRATVEVERYQEFLRKLEGRIQSLGATAQTQEQINKHAEAVRTSEERRRNNALKLANGKQLLEEANGDFSGHTDRRALQRARTFANAELNQLRAQQESAARTVGVSTGEFDTARKAGDEYAKTIALIDQRLDHLATTVRGMPRLNTFGSSQAHAEGKRIYETASLSGGGVASLEGSEAKKALGYLRARQAEQVTYGKQLEKLGGNNKEALNAAGDASRKFAADLDILTAAAKPAGAGLNLLQQTLRSFLKYAIGYGSLYGLVAVFTALGKSLIDLQTELLDIQAVTGSTDAQMGKLTSTISDVARTSKFSLLDLTKATKVLAQAGISVEELNTSLQATANFAAATGANLEVAADLLSTTRSVFKDLSDDTISNQLAKAINISKLTAEDLKTILSLGAQTAKSFNLTSEQFLAAVATLRNAGLKQSTAATGLRQGMLEIFSPDAKLIKALQARYRDLGENMGAEAVRARFFAFSRGRSPLIAALTELKRLGFNDEGAMDLSRAFDIRSTNAIKAMISNLEELAANEGKITFGRAAAEGAATTIEGLNASFTRLISTITSFTYNRSEGLLGYFADVFQGLDNAIQKLDEWDLKRRSMGEVSLSGPNSLFGSIDSAVNPFAAPRNYFKNKIGEMFSSGPTPEEAVDQANSGAQGLSRKRLEFQQFEDSARNTDIRLAKLGETVGSAGDGLVKIEKVSDDLNLTIARVFGPGLEDQRQQLVKLAQSYSNLTISEREVRIDELIKKYPKLKEIDPVQLDRSLASIAGMGTAVDGYLKGQADSLSNELAKAHETLEKLALKDKKPTSPKEIEAVVTEEVALRFPELMDIMRGDSKLVAGQQITIMQMASQAFSDLMRSKGGGGFLENEAKLQAEALLQKIKAISLTRPPATAGVDIRQAVQSLEKENEKLGKNAVSRMQQIKEFLIQAADKLDPGANKTLVGAGVQEITKGQEITGAKSVAEIDARVAVNNELFEKVRTNPDFRTNLLQMPDTTVGREKALSYTAPGSQGIPMEDVLNGTDAYKDFLALAKTFNDTYLKQAEVRKAYKKELDQGRALGDAVEKATTQYNDDRTNKQFPAARDSLNAKINAQIAVENENLAEAERQRVANLSNTDIDKDKTILKNELDAKARVAKLEIERAKELEQINREEKKVNLKRTEGELQGREKRLLGVLDNATNATPQGVIDDTIAELNDVREQLKVAFRERIKLQGTENDLSEAEIAEREKALDQYQKQVGFLELNYRREKGAREDLASLLDITMTTGNPVRDAELEDRGLIPGNRGRRTEFLQGRMGILQELVKSSSSDLGKASADVTRLQAASDADTGNAELSKSLRLAKEYERDLVHETANWNRELGQTGLALERVSGTWKSGFTKAFDPNVISRALEQSESSLEHFGEVINSEVVTALESVGDAFADAALEGESLSGSIEKVFSQLKKETLRTLIKTLSNETISTLTGTLFGAQNGKGQGFFPALLQKFGLGGAGTPASKAPASGTTATEAPVQAGGFMDSVVSTLFGSGPKESDTKDGSCLPKETAEALKKVAESPGLADTAAIEGKVFFTSLGSGFANLLDNVTNGFGKVFGNIGGLLGLGSSKGDDQAIGLFSLATNLMGAFAGGGGGSATYKGAYGFAGGGIIHGPGSGTSDSIPTYVTGAGGQVSGLRVSNGEGILNAKATAALGPDFIHAVNSGRMLNARSGAIVTDQANLSRSTPAAPAASQSGNVAGGTSVYQVRVEPAQMRMRMGDWLDQQILNERARR